MNQEHILKNYEITETKNSENNPIIILSFDINDFGSSLTWEPLDVTYNENSLSIKVKSDDSNISLITEPLSFNKEIYNTLQQYDQIIVAGLNRFRNGNPIEYAYQVNNINNQPKRSNKMGMS